MPNNVKKHPLADGLVGKMCAQATVRVARGSPAAFKASMTNLTPEDRTVLEMAVRADVAGYATPKIAAPKKKKKLSLKGFKSKS